MSRPKVILKKIYAYSGNRVDDKRTNVSCQDVVYQAMKAYPSITEDANYVHYYMNGLVDGSKKYSGMLWSLNDIMSVSDMVDWFMKLGIVRSKVIIYQIATADAYVSNFLLY